MGQPLFTQTPNVSGVAVTAANTQSGGVGTIATDIFLAWTAGASGAFIEKIRWVLTGTTANTTSTATVGRVFLSTQASGATTAANTSMVFEITLASQTADSSTNAAFFLDIPMNIAVPANMTVLVTNHAAPAANSAWKAVVFGGNY
jgi:hypothetical protein